MTVEPHSPVCQAIEGRAGIPLVAVATQPVCAKRVDENEQDVHIVALRELFDIGGRADGAIVLIADFDVVDRRQVKDVPADHEHHGEQPWPALTED